ncbi:MAG TPA: YCF48-related protein, partial [Chloroflexota bacterium]
MSSAPPTLPQRLSRLVPVGVMLLLALAFFPARNAQAGTGSFTTVYADHFFDQLVVDPTNTHIVYAAGSDKNQSVYVFKSFDGGQTFANTSATFAPFSLFAMAIAKVDPQTLYAGGYNGVTKQGAFYYTHNGGATWTAGASGLNGNSVQAIVVDPTIASTVYLGTNAGVYKSTDGGVTVAQLSGMGARSVHALAYDHNTPANFYAGTDSNTDPGIWKTSDNGNTWTNMNSGLPSGTVLQLAFDPTSTQTLYANVATSPNSLVKTTNGGSNWAVINTPGDPIASIAVDPLNGNNVYITTSTAALRSADGGSTFVPIYQKGSGAIVVDGASPQDIYIGGAGITSFTSGPPPITVQPTATAVPTATPQPGVNCQLPASTGSSYTFPQTNHTVSGVWL